MASDSSAYSAAEGLSRRCLIPLDEHKIAEFNYLPGGWGS
eukprot:CAMPEP_0185904218 /NCGR_PEP_ID=MMETSP0196C-20130402/3541_1 /TAXON_ID=2932 /ORGANISM="Alexandrium fundyense, Strain CCMP1719" /LENGTH=39 /DNA_ID= /DNA_START= /DNA_END= /DNA_ORIENTATION=